MKILVPCKSVPDSDQKIHQLPDKNSRSSLDYVINPFDAIALEESLRMRESSTPDAEIVVVSIGPAECEKELRTALAMGADKAILVQHDEFLDPWNVASILFELVQREVPRLILMGKQAVDDDSNQTGQFLAARLGWPQATFASSIELMQDKARVQRETDAGMETVRVPLPAVITTDLRLNEPRYASLPSIMKARKKPIETVTIDDLEVTIEPRVRVLGIETVSSSRTCVKVEDVDELLVRLRDEAKVL